MLAVVPVRDGVLPGGGDETIAECAGRALVVGSGVTDVDLAGIATEVTTLDLGDFAPARWAAVICALVGGETIVLPGSPDGRDLAPRLALALGRPLFAGAVTVTADTVTVARGAGQLIESYHSTTPFVATLQPGVRGFVATSPAPSPAVVASRRPDDAAPGSAHDATVVEVRPPDLSTMDLTEATRIIGGGAGLDDASRFAQLDHIARAIGAVVGATRVVTDRNWVGHERQIGTTGVVVDPELYVSFGVSGAVQHTSGLGDPAHVVSVNTDPHCPMMQMSDLAIVGDANAVLDELALRLVEPTRTVAS